ncbi:HAD family hydrolase [Candidatus Bathyarchaeota archaeon]|nr:HAD family hydrolase [Candidatus Bathyarchaeota archaeon]
MSLQAVLFDRDGTLFDTKVRNVFGQLCRRYILSLEKLHINLFPKVDETIEYLFSLNLDLALISSGTGTTATMNILKSLGLDQFFKSILTLDDYDRPTPVVALMQRLFSSFNETFKVWQISESLRRLNVLPSQALVVGDSPLDIKAGKRVGTKTAFVTKGSTKHVKHLEILKPDVIIQNVLQLPEAIERFLVKK